MPADKHDSTHSAAQRGDELAQRNGVDVMTTCQSDEHRDESDNQGRCGNANQLHTGAHQRVVDEVPYQAKPEE
ncbi:hypothetical protein D3C75_577710 [compost metagenome]